MNSDPAVLRQQLAIERGRVRELEGKLCDDKKRKVLEIERHQAQLRKDVAVAVSSQARAVTAQARAERSRNRLVVRMRGCIELIISQTGIDEPGLERCLERLIALHLEDCERLVLLEDEVKKLTLELGGLSRATGWGRA